MFQRHTTALTVSWPCSVLCRTAQVHVWGSAAGLRRERGSPRGPGQMATVSGADVDSQSSQSVFWPAATHSATHWDRGLAQCGAHLTTEPSLTWVELHCPETQSRAEAAAPQASPGWGSVVLGEGSVTHTSWTWCSLCEPDTTFPLICPNIEEVEAGIYIQYILKMGFLISTWKVKYFIQ